MKCTFKCTIQVHELAPPTCVLKILIDPLTLSYFSPYVKVLPLVITSSPITLYLCFSHTFVINDHKGLILDRLRLSMPINLPLWDTPRRTIDDILSTGSKLINLYVSFECAFHIFACIAQVLNFNIHACVEYASCRFDWWNEKLACIGWYLDMPYICFHKWYKNLVYNVDLTGI